MIYLSSSFWLQLLKIPARNKESSIIFKRNVSLLVINVVCLAIELQLKKSNYLSFFHLVNSFLFLSIRFIDTVFNPVKYVSVPKLFADLFLADAWFQQCTKPGHTVFITLKTVPVAQMIVPGKSIGQTKLHENAKLVFKRLGQTESGDAAMGKFFATWYANHDPAGYQTQDFLFPVYGGYG